LLKQEKNSPCKHETPYSVLSIVSCVVRSLWRIVVPRFLCGELLSRLSNLADFEQVRSSIFPGANWHKLSSELVHGIRLSIPGALVVTHAMLRRLINCRFYYYYYYYYYPCLQSGGQFYIVTPVWR